jgi:transposase
LVDGEWVIKAEFKPDNIYCPICKNDEILMRGGNIRRFLCLPEGTLKISVECLVPIVYCPNCKVKWQINIEFANDNSRMTKMLESKIIDSCFNINMKLVAKMYFVSEQTVRRLFLDYFTKNYSKPNLNNLKFIAIDEFA